MTPLSLVSSFRLTEIVENKIYMLPASNNLGRMRKHAIAVVATSVTAVIDTIYHAILGVITFFTGLVVTPYNFIAGAINKKYKAPVQLELSHAIIHLAMTLLTPLNPLTHLAQLIQSDSYRV
jgi:hypothetical protein